MEFTYENQGTNTYLVYQIGVGDEVDTMSLGMLTNNKITGLIPAIFTQMDKDRFIKYNVSAKVSVKQFFSGAVNKKRVIGVFTGIVNAMMSAEEYMINPANILLDLDYIYTDVSTCETNLICLPVIEGEDKAPDLGSMFKNIVFSTRFDQTEDCDYVAKILNYLNSSPIFSLEDFKKVLEEISKGQLEKPTKDPKPAVLQKTPAPVQKASAPIQKTAGQPQQINVPQQENAQQMPPVSGQPEEKHISMMTLLTHYNKENKALYKKQKEQKKNAVKTKKPAKVQSKAVENTGFAIPGQSPEPPAAPQIPQKAAPASAASIMPGQTITALQPAPQAMPQQVSQPISQHVPQARPANFGETTVLSAGNNIGETTVLGAASAQTEVRPMLYRQKTNEKILLDKPVFRIGKERSYVDYFIGDNTAISRSHANILTKDNGYYIVDTNSTNHTYVNGVMIQSNVETKLTHGTKIQLANEEFEFRMY